MHDLRKQECDNALDRVARFCSFYEAYKDAEHLKLHGELDILSRLIDEHFLNPPLTWEEIKEDMWCWDNAEKEYIFIFKAWMSTTNVRLIQYCGMDETVRCQFEDGRFFRKEVRNEC